MTGTRSYIAALGSSAALLGAVVLACVALSGLVGAGGFPKGSGEADASRILVDASLPGDDLFAAADPLLDSPNGASSDVVRAETDGSGRSGDTSARDEATGDDDAGSGGDTGAGDTGPGGDPGSGGGDDDQGTGGGDDGGAEVPPDEPETPPSGEPPVDVPTTPASGGDRGAVGSTVEGIDQVVGGATGIDPGLGEVTEPVTGPVDDVVGGLLGHGNAAPQTTP